MSQFRKHTGAAAAAGTGNATSTKLEITIWTKTKRQRDKDMVGLQVQGGGLDDRSMVALSHHCANVGVALSMVTQPDTHQDPGPSDALTGPELALLQQWHETLTA